MAEETEIIYQSEADLPVVSSPSSIGHLRAVDINGSSALVSQKQLREVVGIDYSLLTEQVVQGMFLPDIDGIKKQVYAITVRGVTPSENNRMDFPIAAKNVWWVSGYIETLDHDMQPPYIIANNNFDYYYCLGVNPAGSASIHDIGARLRGCKYVFTFNYIKL